MRRSSGFLFQKPAGGLEARLVSINAISSGFVRIEAILGDRKAAIIVPEESYNKGWGDSCEDTKVLGKIRRSEVSSCCRRREIVRGSSKNFSMTSNQCSWNREETMQGGEE
ncbi:hypothetical protein HAX54_022395 [Datura stramonium]|uniref:Uncharacterized protein n=1 Tax=Datura stramonium TaxID=4076 RepID=A0ABS8RJS7_DATST|nr:hypothetical protein [Datura stramonium]